MYAARSASSTRRRERTRTHASRPAAISRSTVRADTRRRSAVSRTVSSISRAPCSSFPASAHRALAADRAREPLSARRACTRPSGRRSRTPGTALSTAGRDRSRPSGARRGGWGCARSSLSPQRSVGLHDHGVVPRQRHIIFRRRLAGYRTRAAVVQLHPILLHDLHRRFQRGAQAVVIRLKLRVSLIVAFDVLPAALYFAA